MELKKWWDFNPTTAQTMLHGWRVHDHMNDVNRASLNVQNECLRAYDATMERIAIL
jgi:hypothetical protein